MASRSARRDSATVSESSSTPSGVTDSAAACTPPRYRGATPAALRLIVSRALLDVAAAVRAYEHSADWSDYVGYEVLRGACGMPEEEALTLTRSTAHQALTALAEQIEETADDDFDRAVRAIGLTVRSARTGPAHVQHHVPRTRPARPPAA